MKIIEDSIRTLVHSYIPSKSQFFPAWMLTSEMLEVNDIPEEAGGEGERERSIMQNNHIINYIRYINPNAYQNIID